MPLSSAILTWPPALPGEHRQIHFQLARARPGRIAVTVLPALTTISTF
jgi:hypothetical protein